MDLETAGQVARKTGERDGPVAAQVNHLPSARASFGAGSSPSIGCLP
ncbi:hypothetical protein [Kineosporia sp. NBRC 101731]|nr:hypothetical protein [Kineosporia sp. NBRC 101731]